MATQGYITTQNSIGSLSNRTTVNIASDSTGVTQTLNDNTTKIATTAFVRQEVADLIGSAPGALDTLQELATALGDDPNFSTSVFNAIALKADATGGTTNAQTRIMQLLTGFLFRLNPNNTTPSRIRLGNVIFLLPKLLILVTTLWLLAAISMEP